MTTADRVLEHFDRISEAPDAIPRLRRFILDLAVRGKLTAQDPNDEPAFELLERVASERARLVKDSARRRGTFLPAVVTDDEEPFDVPVSWRWVRFADIVDFSAGRTPSRNDSSFWNTGDHAWVSIADMDDGQVLRATKETVSSKARERVFGSEPEPSGTILMSFKLTIGKIARLGIPAFHNEAIISIRPDLADLDAYLFLVLPQFARQGDTKGAIKGATLNRKSIANILIPLPSLAEQHRIVAKVDELMALCDQLKAAQKERESRRDRLASESLARLCTPADTPSFREHARFHLRQLPRMTGSREHIQQLRQAILDLAVRGRLVPRRPANEEGAASLLVRLKVDAESYSLQHGVTPPKPEPLPSELPFRVPTGWQWARLCTLFRVITDGDHLPPPRSEDGVAFLTIGNITTGLLDFAGCRLVPRTYFDCIVPYRRPSRGDILYTVVGATFGRPAPVDTDRNFCVQRHIAILKPARDANVKFLSALLASRMVYTQAKRSLTGIAQPTIPLRRLRNFLVCVPPLDEQQRIVAKVDELMTVCGHLEAHLEAGRVAQMALLEASLRDALAEEEQVG